MAKLIEAKGLTDGDLDELVLSELLGLTNIAEIKTQNPFERRKPYWSENAAFPVLDLMRDPNNFYFTCKHLLNKKLAPFQLAVMKTLWTHSFPMLIACRGASKSFLLALYSILKCVFHQGIKIVIVGAAFRQAKVVFDYCEDVWRNSPILRSICGNQDGPTHTPDMYILRIGESKIICLPMGTGEKIRGQRAGITIAEEFASISRLIFENVVLGFGAVSTSPIEKMERAARLRTLKKLGYVGDGGAGAMSNQLILSGTAYYGFNHFAEYHRRWKDIIESKGDVLKLEEVFGGPVPDKFNWKDYAVIRLPVDLLPEGFMDEKTVAQAKATIHHSNYLIEYGACFTSDTPVLTPTGTKPISELTTNDQVLTHHGNFKPVKKVTYRDYKGDLLCYRLGQQLIRVTPEHPFWDGQDWIAAENLAEKVHVARPVTYGSVLLDLRDYLGEFTDKKIGPKHFLSRDFGYLMGVYANCGYIRTGGQRCGFYFDQSNPNIDAVCKTFERVFGFPIRHDFLRRKQRHSGKYLEISSKILGQFFTKISSRYKKNRAISPEFLFCNDDYVKGFIDGVMASANGSLVRSRNATFISQCYLVGLAAGYDPEYLSPKRWPGTTYKAFALNLNTSSAQTATTSIVTKARVPYKGKVYNLEVEDDHSYTILGATVHNCFALDSNNFFKRSLIESCVVGKPESPITLPSCGEAHFSTVIRGRKGRQYVMAIDPASEIDNFSITILEIWPEHRRIVFGWTINAKRHKEKIKRGVIENQDYYSYVARKIMDLNHHFPCLRIGMDSEGGGRAVREALYDKKNLKPDELPILPIIVDDDPKDTDGMPGLHILELVNFSKSDWVNEANHGMRKDFEDKVLLFPEFDSAELGLALEEDKIVGRTGEDGERLYDTLEDAVFEIEELKDELATIVHTQVGITMRDRWDTPEKKEGDGKKGRLRKDRYTSLLIANMIARQLARVIESPEYDVVGGFSRDVARVKKDKKANDLGWIGPAWFMEKAKNLTYGMVVKK